MEKHFKTVVVGLISLILVAFVLQCAFDETTPCFGYAGGAFFLSIFFWFGIKNALTPPEFGSGWNPLKYFYHRRGKLSEYRKICQGVFVVVAIGGVACLICGLCDILITYVKMVLAA